MPLGFTSLVSLSLQICFFCLFLLLQLSLRENPLVVRFVQEISLNPPSLMELAARVIRTASISYGPNELPRIMRDYLDTANCCVNPKCQGESSRHIGCLDTKKICEKSLLILIFFTFFQVFSSIIALNISNSWISVANIVFHCCNICALPSKLFLLFALFSPLSLPFCLYFAVFFCPRFSHSHGL